MGTDERQELGKAPGMSWSKVVMMRLLTRCCSVWIARRVDFPAHEKIGGPGRARRETQAADQEVTDRARVNRVGFGEGESGLSVVEFDLVGVDAVVEKARCGAAAKWSA